MGLNPGGFGSNWTAIKTPYVTKSSTHFTCHLAQTYPNSTKKSSKLREKNENLSPHLNMQYFTAVSNDHQVSISKPGSKYM